MNRCGKIPNLSNEISYLDDLGVPGLNSSTVTESIELMLQSDLEINNHLKFQSSQAVLLEQEVCYNIAKAFHNIGVIHLATAWL